MHFFFNQKKIITKGKRNPWSQLSEKVLGQSYIVQLTYWASKQRDSELRGLFCNWYVDCVPCGKSGTNHSLPVSWLWLHRGRKGACRQQGSVSPRRQAASGVQGGLCFLAEAWAGRTQEVYLQGWSRELEAPRSYISGFVCFQGVWPSALWPGVWIQQPVVSPGNSLEMKKHRLTPYRVCFFFNHNS